MKGDIIFFACTAAINILLTGLIVGKIVSHTRSITKSLGETNVRWSNAVIFTMIESSALFSICAIATAITQGDSIGLVGNAGTAILAVTSQMTVSFSFPMIITINLILIVHCSNSHRIPCCIRHLGDDAKARLDSDRFCHSF